MGAWGTAIFEEDFAADIRDEWREAIEDGLTPEAATSLLMAKYHADEVPDDDYEPTFWIALAASQAATGRLQPEVKSRALDVIAAGGDVYRFAEVDARIGHKREAALLQLADALRGPPRAPTVIKRPKPRLSPAVAGDLVLVRGSGSRHRAVYFFVLGTTDAWPRGSTAPEIVGLRWRGADAPTATEAGTVPFLRTRGPSGTRFDVYMVQGPTRGPHAFTRFAEVVASGVTRRDAPDPRSRECRYVLTEWRGLAQIIDEDWFAKANDLGGPKDRLRRLRLPWVR